MAIVYLVQTVEGRPGVRDPSLETRTVDKADRAGRWLARVRIAALYTSVDDQAWRMAPIIAARCGVVVHRDERVRDRDDESSQQAGARLRDFVLADRPYGDAPVAVLTHSGVTVDLLRTLMGDDTVPAKLLRDGVTEGSITTLDGPRVVRIAQRPGTA